MASSGRQMLPCLQGERLDKDGWGSPNVIPPIIPIRTGTPARIRRHSLLNIRQANRSGEGGRCGCVLHVWNIISETRIKEPTMLALGK